MGVRRHTWQQAFEGADHLSRGLGLGCSVNCCARSSLLVNLDVVEEGLISEDFRDGSRQIQPVLFSHGYGGN